jgi:glycosyltransferase involved in cell wall biosynthesis
MKFGVVAIGRNEGERLRRCLSSLPRAAPVVYVDSNSTDGSALWAREHGVDVIELDTSAPFTAARARNLGFRRLQKLIPNIPYIQFMDGDCELNEEWPERALSFLELHEDVCITVGRLREQFPERSVYN